MRVVTIVSLGASAVLGLGALVVAQTLLPQSMNGKVAMAAPRVEGVPVVVASKPLKFGDKLEGGHLKLVRIPKDAVPEGAFSTVEAVLSQDGGGAPVALTAIAEREPLLPSKLSGPGARSSVAAEIADGMRAYTIRVSDVSGVGGHALPGDRVDVMLTRDLTPEGSKRTFVSSVLVQNIRVLAVDLNADLTSDKPATPSTATLEVDLADSQKLASASDLGKLSLALRPMGSTEVAAVSSGGLAPAAPAVRTASRSAPRRQSPGDGGGLIMIVEGDGRGGRDRPAPPQAQATVSVTAPVPLPEPKPAPSSSFKPNIG
ncbi:Flp pilus assembly protein CpaB [Phenylobacterium deserti]|uniref:Flp pilus assembly protein CpaB n=1 Tax=Phenylobacterium deserti TaxID=1914756 RepID=A0A328APL5_9CAUL|nr:Flp pilus assembly protein CpaB [Phenylobacterium deserti]RAK56910.1 Flp pilus assembly protein CpaB [Phenylobacterium deserti]